MVSADGGEPKPLTDDSADDFGPEVSADGRYVIFDSTRTNVEVWRIDIDGGAPVKTFDLPVTSGTSLYEKLFYRGFHWSPDGQALVYLNTLSGVSNLWRQPLDGSPAKQITDFKSDLVYNFAYSHDGRRLAFSRGSQTRDAVLITDVK